MPGLFVRCVLAVRVRRIGTNPAPFSVNHFRWDDVPDVFGDDVGGELTRFSRTASRELVRLHRSTNVDRMAYTCVYAKEATGAYMQRKARIFMNNRSQAVRLPKEFQFQTQEVFIRKEGSAVVLSPRPFDWTSYLAESPVASAKFMEDVEDLPVQEREP